MNIEKALRNYIEGKGNKIKYEEFINLVKSNGNNAANVLFKLVNEQLDTMSDTKCLDRTIEVLKYLIMSNFVRYIGGTVWKNISLTQMKKLQKSVRT